MQRSSEEPIKGIQRGIREYTNKTIIERAQIEEEGQNDNSGPLTEP